MDMCLDQPRRDETALHVDGFAGEAREGERPHDAALVDAEIDGLLSVGEAATPEQQIEHAAHSSTRSAASWPRAARRPRGMFMNDQART